MDVCVHTDIVLKKGCEVPFCIPDFTALKPLAGLRRFVKVTSRILDSGMSLASFMGSLCTAGTTLLQWASLGLDQEAIGLDLLQMCSVPEPHPSCV